METIAKELSGELMQILMGVLLAALSAAAAMIAAWAKNKAKESKAGAFLAVEQQIQATVERHVQAVEQEAEKLDEVTGRDKKAAAETGIKQDLQNVAVAAAKTVGKKVFWGLVGNIGKRVETSVFRMNSRGPG
ncbi:MAG: hypothetical protein KJ954_13895 [Alphaproteobacteria bacterium]|nr:hypothetical protein [Alphaproteobacteria bacterium]